MSESKNRGGTYFKFSTDHSRITNKLTQAKKDNDLIYNDSIPKPEQLTPVGAAALAKPLPLSQPMSTNFKGNNIYIVFRVEVNDSCI